MNIHHLGLVVADIDAAIAEHRALFGEIEVHGPIVDPLQEVEIVMLRPAHGTWIELLRPLTDSSPLQRALEAGGGLNHLCYAVPDVPSAVESLVARGCMPVRPRLPAVAFGGRDVAFLYSPHQQVFELVDERAVAPFCVPEPHAK